MAVFDRKARVGRLTLARAFPHVWALLCLAAATFSALGPAAAETPLRLMAFGDSLTHGYGLAPEDSFPAQLEAALRAKDQAVEVINAGNSGDTTAAGLARLDWALADRPDAVILELGANDALRGLDPADARANLDAILERLGQQQLPVLMAGMQAPRNLGRHYWEAFDAIFPALAEKHNVLLYPFFLDGVALDPQFNQPDGIHPNAAGVAVIVERILPSVLGLVRLARANAGAASGGGDG